MRFWTFLILGFLVAGCSKISEPATQHVLKQTLSGIFESKNESGPGNYYRLDFRTDGTLIYKMQAVGGIKVADETARMTVEGNGKGRYTILDDKVTADIVFLASVSYSPSYGVKPKLLDPQTNQRIFRIDGDDLISLSIAVVGEKTNTDNQTRWMRMR